MAISKKLILFILVFVLIIGFWFGKDLIKESDQPLSSPEPRENQLLKVKSIEIKETNDKYEIQVNYPEFFNSVFFEAEKIANTFLKDQLSDNVERFKNDFAENNINIPEMKSTMETDYEEIMLTDKLASIRFDNYQYVAGAAHPNSFYSVFNYNFEKNKQIELVDFFNLGSDFLPIISNIAFQDIRRQLEEVDLFAEKTLRQGLESNINNFSNFNFDKEKIIFVFDAYQLGAYAIGPRFVSIFYNQLKEFNNKSELLELIEQY